MRTGSSLSALSLTLRAGLLSIPALVPCIATAQLVPPPLAPAQQPAPAAIAPPPAKPSVPDQSGPTITLTLTSGETMRGVVKTIDNDAITIIHPVLGLVRIPRVGISTSEPTLDKLPAPPSAAEAPAPKPESTPEPKPEPKPAPKPAPKPDPQAAQVKLEPKQPVAPTNPIEALLADDEKSFWDGWKRQIELGVNGTTGPIDSQNYRAYVNLTRATLLQNTVATIVYVRGENNFGTTQDRSEFSARNDWKIAGGKWSMWASARMDWDNRQRWDGRVSAAGGLGYVFEKNDKWNVVGRLGAGLAREINGDNAIIPEVGIAAFSVDYKINDKWTAYANSEYFPDSKTWGDYRTISRAGFNLVIDPELKMNLRLGTEYRFDSDAPTDRASVLDYFAVLGFAF